MKHRPIVILTVAFTVILAAGVALAQVGSFLPGFGEVSGKQDVVATELPEDSTAPVLLEPVSDEKPPAQEQPGKEAPAVESPEKEIPAEESPDEEKPKEAQLDDPKEPAVEPEPVEEPADSIPPKLVITSPKDGAHFTERALTYSGKTEPGARVFAGEWEAEVTDSGEWFIVLMLSEGKNITTFRAKDAAGNVAKATVAVYLDGSDHSFTVKQKYGTNSSPWEKFYGTAAPGTVIELMSKHGNARLVAEGGEWYLKLHFEGLVEATTFPIVLETSTNLRKEFTFTYQPKAVEFSAHQKYGTNASPWEKFYGTAAPGTVIELGSAYGNARLVTEGYEWYLKLHFEGLSEPTTFPIVLHTSTGVAMDFMFTYQPMPVEFTAHQKYGSCGEPEPYDKFYGTATPKSTITVNSAWGSGTTVASSDGHWDLRVYFTGAPNGEPFPVSVSDAEGHVKYFEFVSYAGGGK